MPVLAGPTGVPLPAAPSLLTATLQGGPQVSLTWRDNATTETVFVLERSTDLGVTFVPVATPPARANTGNVTYVDTLVKPATAYQYRVMAVNGSGSSAYSSTSLTVTVPPLPSAPSGLVASAINVNKNKETVTLTWTDNASNETGFTIQRSMTAAFTTVTTSTAAANATTFSQTGVARNQTFYYRVRASNLGGASAWSNVASILTP